MMRNLFRSVLLITLSLRTGYAGATPTSVGKLVLRLPYRGLVSEKTALAKPLTLGMFEASTYFLSGNLLGTDWQGNFYLSDPVAERSFVLRRFDKTGRFREAWQPLPSPLAKTAVVTRNSYIWVAIDPIGVNQNTIPVVVYRSGQKRPVLDWRSKAPDAVLKRIAQLAARQNLRVDPRFDARSPWIVSALSTNGKNVLIQMNGPLGVMDYITRSVWLLMTGDGKRILNARLAQDDKPTLGTSLSPNGKTLQDQSDLQIPSFKWEMVWLWQQGQQQGTPLIDKTRNAEPFAGVLRLGKARPPGIYIDLKGNTYLNWSREGTKRYTRRIIVGKLVRDMSVTPGLNDERALLVLNAKKQPIASVPWTPCLYENRYNWIVPLPDGSGFYRSEYAERELRIYFHALPQTSPQRTRPNVNRNRRSRSNTR